MKKLIFMLTAVIFIFTACQKEEATLDTTAAYESGFHKANPYNGNEGCAETFTTPMIADGGEHDEYCTGTEVGTITVNKSECVEDADGISWTTFVVKYEITEPGWVIDFTHLYVGPEGDIPATGKIPKRNPKIGHFDFSTEHDGVQDYTYPPITVVCDNDNVIAAHANVSIGDPDPPYSVETFCEDLPETATISVVMNPPVSYFTVTVSDDGWLDGEYPGWCIDAYHGITLFPPTTYPSSGVYCMDEAGHFVDYHENLHLVNWVLNQGYRDLTSPVCGGLYTYADIQYAIWTLVDFEQPDGPGQFGALYNECRIAEIVADAEAYAAANPDEPYEPGCGDIAIVVFDPGEYTNTDVQKIIIELPLACEETAWGYGYCAECGENGYCDDGTWSDGPVANGISFTDSPLYGGKAWGWYFYGCQPSQD